MKFKLLFVILLVNVSQVFAHAIWIETSSTGKIGQAQEVKIFLGEYASNERDSLSHWFSNTKESTLFLTAPDGKKTQLSATPAGNYLAATFTPAVAGVYTLSIDLPLTMVYGTTRIHYYAVATVVVNQSLSGVANVNKATELTLKTELGKANKVNTLYSATLLNKSGAVKAASLSIQSPEGWAKTIKGDDNGKFTFNPMWSGRYLLEGTYTEEGSGTHEGKEYTSTWYCVTYCVDFVK